VNNIINTNPKVWQTAAASKQWTVVWTWWQEQLRP